VYFWDRCSWTICLDWPQTLILLISAFWIARIIGVNHWRVTWFWFFWTLSQIWGCRMAWGSVLTSPEGQQCCFPQKLPHFSHQQCKRALVSLPHQHQVFPAMLITIVLMAVSF
jgi:hypothetical protein